MSFRLRAPQGRPRLSWLASLAFDRELIVGWLLIGGFATLGALVGVPLRMPPQQCLIDTGFPTAKPQTDVNVTVREGVTCAVLVRTGGATVEDLRIVTPPKLGTVSQSRRTDMVYHAPRTLRGNDDFAFELRGRAARHEFTSTVRVAVTVE